MTAAGRLGVGIVGAGRVGPVLGAALAGTGHAIVGVATVSDAGRERAEALLPGAPRLDVRTLVERSELVLLAVPEYELADLVAGLAEVGAWLPGQLVVHTAPGVGVAVLAPAAAAGAIPLALNPAMAFTGTSMDLARLQFAYCAVTASGARAADRPRARRRDGLRTGRDRRGGQDRLGGRAQFRRGADGYGGAVRRGPAARDRRRVARPRARARRPVRPGAGARGRDRTGTAAPPRSGARMTLSTVAAIADTRAAVAALRRDGRRVALVPTMGALHDGHLALVARAHEVADVVVASVFVNPLQFGPAEDFDRYPRTLAADAAALEAAGVDLLFAPSVADMYPEGGTQITVSAGPVGSVLEGSVRPGHFDGMLTVVAKLLHIVGPDVVLFGRKDAQQVYLVRRMVTDLDLPVAVEVVADRPGGRRPGPIQPQPLPLRGRPGSCPRACPPRSRRPRPLPTTASTTRSPRRGRSSAAVDGVELDYLVAVDPATFQPVDDRYRGPALVLVAARVGGTRLIDNELVSLG